MKIALFWGLLLSCLGKFVSGAYCPAPYDDLEIPSGYAQVSGSSKYYKYDSNNKEFYESVYACQDEGTQLATIKSEEEMDVIGSFSSNDIWIGLTNQGRINNPGNQAILESLLYWIDGSPYVDHSAEVWLDEAQLNGGDPCMAYNINQFARLQDKNCGGDKKSVCEFDCTTAFTANSDGWLTRGRRMYYFDHSDSSTFAQAEGGSLASLESEEEALFMRSYVRYRQAQGMIVASSYRIGLQYDDSEWLWDSNNEEANFQDWHSSEPNGYASEPTAVLFGNHAYQWADAALSHVGGYICEKEKPPACEPGQRVDTSDTYIDAGSQSSPEACQAACQLDEANCDFFVYTTSTLQCLLHKLDPDDDFYALNRRDEALKTSGKRNCIFFDTTITCTGHPGAGSYQTLQENTTMAV